MSTEPCDPIPDPNDEQEKMINRALDDTIAAIKGAATTRFESDGIATTVTSGAELRWRIRYRPMYTYAVVCKNLDWDKYKHLVLERAKQVGIIAANMASMRAIILAWIIGDLDKGGEDVHVGNTPRPEINSLMAELASLCVDCKGQEMEPGVRWDWCSTAFAPPFVGLDVRAEGSPKTCDLVMALLKDTCRCHIEAAEALSQQLAAL